MKKLNSIKMAFILPTLLLVTVIYTAQSGISLYLIKTTVKEKVEENLKLNAKNEANKIYRELLAMEKIAVATANIIESMKSYDTDFIFSALKKNVELNPLIHGTGIWFEPYKYKAREKYFGPYWLRDKNGKIKLTWVYNTPEYDYFSWDWYRNPLKQNGKIVWTGPYYDYVSGLVFITAASVIQKQDKTIGVVSVDMTIREFQDYLPRVKIGERGFAFIIEPDGSYFGEKFLEDDTKDNITKGEAREIRKIGKKIIHSDKTEVERGNWKGEDVFIAHSPVNLAGLKMVLILPVSEVYESFNRVLTTSIITFLLAIILISIVLTTIFSKKILNPLSIMINKMKKVAGGDFNTNSTSIGTNDEMEELNSSFSIMTDNLRSVIQKEKFLRRIMLTSVGSPDIKDTIRTIINQTCRQLKSKSCFIVEYDEKKQELLFTRDYQTYTTFSDEFIPIFNKITAERRVLAVNDLNNFDLQESEREICDKFGIKSFMAVPILYRNTSLGVLCVVYTESYKTFTKADTELLYAIANQSAVVIYQAKLFNQIREVESMREIFLVTFTHDLRSPINGIQKVLEAILAEKFGTSLENFSELLENIHKTNKELLSMVNNLLSIYHYESGSFELNMELSSIEDIIEDVIRIMEPLAKEQNSEITKNIQKNLPQVMIDKDEINRVMTNLISNAIKHNKKNTSIYVSAERVNNEIKVSVRDNGQGIAESEKAKIFQKYPSTKRKIGTGLGLYLSKQIIDAHQGKIWFESVVDEGTVFYFTLPISE